MDDHEDCIIFLLAKAYQRAHGLFKKKLSPFDITPVQHLILEILQKGGTLSPAEITEKAVMDGATLSGVIDRMVEAGLITREENHMDRRSNYISLTTKGKGLWEILSEQRKEINDEVTVPFSLEEQRLLKRMLKEIKDIKK